MRFLFQILFHIAATVAGILMIVFGVKNDNTTLWVWGIVVLILANLGVYFIMFLIGLLMVPAARRQDSTVGINNQSIQNRVKYCKQCGQQVAYSIMICPNCGNKTYTEEAPKGINVENTENK